MDDLSKIIKNLSDKSPIFGKRRRKKAVEELSKIGTAEVVPYLVESLSDSDPDIKRSAFTGLSHLKDESAISSLCSLYLKTRDKKVWEIIISRGFSPSHPKERILFFIKTGQIAKCIPPSLVDIPILIELLADSENHKEAFRILSSINDLTLQERIFDIFFLNTNPALLSFLMSTGWSLKDEAKRLIFYLFIGRDEDALFIEKKKEGSLMRGYKLLGDEGKNSLISLLFKKPGLLSLIYKLILEERNLGITRQIFKGIIENNLKEALIFFLKRKSEDLIINIMDGLSLSNDSLLEIGLTKGGLVLCNIFNQLKKRGFKTEDPLLLEFMEYVRGIEDEILRVNIDALSGKNKREAISILESIRDERAMDSLISALLDQNPRIRRKASNCLVAISGPAVKSSLIKAFEEEKDWKLRIICAETLAKMGISKMVEFLQKALFQEEWGVCEEAALSLAKLCHPSSEDFFVKGLRHHNIKVRRISACSLGKIGSDRSIKPLLRALEDRDEIVRLHAAYSIANIGKKYPISLPTSGKSLFAKGGIIRVIGLLKDESLIDFLLHSLNEQDWRIRREAIRSLGKIGRPEFVKPLIKMLQDERLEVKREASFALALLGEEKGFGLFVDGIKSKNWCVQVKIAWMISNYITENRERAAKILAELTKDQNPQVRLAAIIGIGMMRDEKFVPTLLMSWTQEREVGIKKRIISSLINIGSLKGQRAFILGLQDKEEDIRVMSVRGFGRLRIKDGFTPLFDKIDSFSGKERKAIFSSLRQIIEEFGIEIPEKNLLALDKKIRELGDIKREADEITEILLLRLCLAVLKYKKRKGGNN